MEEFEEEQISPLKSFILTYLLPEKCYQLFFHQLHLTHGPCVRMVLGKVLAMWSLVSLLAPVPQVWRLVRSGSSEGLSLVSALLDLLAVSAHVAFCVHHGFPIGAWGESVCVLVLLALVMFLIQHYRGNSLTGGVSVVVYAVFLYLLASPLTPQVLISESEEWSVLIVITSRLIQVGCNYSNGSTGQLSGVCVFLQFMGSLGRVFGSIQDSGHSLRSQAVVLASCGSAVLLLQVLLFRNRRPVGEERERGRDGERERKKEE
ncbi:mannose-P-dolichol utilization defect 1 protein isoform X1 [Astyanax mexicanus]|uniref:mannose-P-dolichol utilization defect 1 protein isoform X1 n=2 Tax=Astyanax mexicanus TaxID=7994 RepID=UPI0020CABD7D|nr:mannose-P-dolichol utilization defect 1 protein isoform X1 [Astyanax mexicanus]